MSGLWTQHGLFVEQYAQLTAGGDDYAYTTVAAPGTAHTKGAWTEVVAASAYDVDVGGLLLRFGSTYASATDTSMLLDIGIGPAGSEVVLVENLQVGHTATIGGMLGGDAHYYLPLFVPAGARIACRVQSVVASATVLVAFDLYGGPDVASHPLVFHACETVGTNLATSNGPFTTNGAWVELTAGCAFPFRHAIPMAGGPTGNMFGDYGIMRLGAGGAGSEKTISNGYRINSGSDEVLSRTGPHWMPILADFPAGTRVAFMADGSSAMPPRGAALLFR